MEFIPSGRERRVELPPATGELFRAIDQLCEGKPAEVVVAAVVAMLSNVVVYYCQDEKQLSTIMGARLDEFIAEVLTAFGKDLGRVQ